MTCVECRAIRADQMKEFFCDNKENCREAYQNGYNQALEDGLNADSINKFVVNAITEFQKFYKEHGYPTLGDIIVILSDVEEQLKEQNK
ncbi:MAG: hypothetical protein MJZ34_13380 [Paludibacteraceae bacterium]|nr:hypothetical protein [Paludibacteraceae bacterium]